MSLACGQTPAEKCDATAGGKLSIGVEATQPPANGYTTFQVLVNYSSNLTFQDQPGLAEAKPAWGSMSVYRCIPVRTRVAAT